MVLNLLALLLTSLLSSAAAAGLPVITTGPTNATAVSGTSVTFLCEASGKPTPDILIVRRDTHLTLPSSRSHHGASSEVSVYKTLHNVRPEDAGWYECVASNSVGHVTSAAYLEVVSDPCEQVTCTTRKYCHVTEAGAAECRCKECGDMTYSPVCGSDCTSYLNVCQLRSRSCESGLGLSVLHKGECSVEEAHLKVDGLTEVVEGEALSLTCEAAGFPDPTGFRWAKIMKNGKQKIVGVGKQYVVKVADLKDAGDYRCIAQQCKNRIKSEAVSVEVSSRNVHGPEVRGKTCQVFGDPHIVTFDGRKYDFMGRCNYIMAMDCTFTSNWMVLGQFVPCGEGVTCLDQITIYYGSMVPIVVARGWMVGQNGEKFRLHKNKATLIGDATVTYTGLTVEVELPGGVTIVHDGFWGVQITVAEEAVTCGLCGDNNGEDSDDLTTGRYGPTGGDITAFGQSWAMWSAEWCGMEEVRSEVDNSTCQVEEVEARCEVVLGELAECTAAIGHHFLREACVLDGCRTRVERFEGEPVCAVTHSLAQICAGRGFQVPEDFMDKAGCGPVEDFQERVYNSGCPLAGNPPFLDQ